jgi:PRONE (Plant-specific Rop nucleotide exchanger)
VNVPTKGLSDKAREHLQNLKEKVNQVLKAAMAINANSLAEMEVPESYIESLPKVGQKLLHKKHFHISYLGFSSYICYLYQHKFVLN